MTDITFRSARSLAAMIRRGKIGCLELLDHHLARVERFNAALNAIVVTQIPEARRRAKAADRALKKGDIWGPLHGVPMTVKESFDVAGLPTTWGSPDFKNNIANSNALAVDRLLAAGAVIFGKTNVPIWLADAQTFNVIYGATNNPWDLSRGPGGSSGGEAAALAAGLIAMGMGSDIASSIRNPAHFCGLFGHKPTYGICPPHGHSLTGNPSPMDILDIGPLARTAGDVALGLSILSGPDEIDAAGYRLVLPPPRKKTLCDFKVGILMDHPTSPVDREVSDLLQQLANFLAQEKVAISDRARPDIDMDEIHRAFNIMLRAATSQGQTDAIFAANIKATDALRPQDDSKAARMLRGVTIRHRDWLKMDEQRHRMRWKWHEFFKNHDLMLCPVFGKAAFPHDYTPPYERMMRVNGKKIPFNTLLFWAGYSGLAYLPASVAPIGFTRSGLPVGVQIVGPQYGDRTCLQFARLLEKEYQAFVPPPGYQ
jgi:amidase